MARTSSCAMPMRYYASVSTIHREGIATKSSPRFLRRSMRWPDFRVQTMLWWRSIPRSQRGATRSTQPIKANRPDKPADACDWSAIAPIHLEAFGWRSVSFSGWEADDIIATLQTRAASVDTWKTTVFSGDSDLLALSCDTCDVRTPAAGDGLRFPVRGREWIYGHYGVAPQALPYFKALVGEPGDNLPGVSGVGPV